MNPVQTPISAGAPPPARRRSLYRTVLGVAVAALVAAWLPFWAFYATAVHNQPTVRVVTTSHGRGRVITTRTSSGQIIRSSVPASGSAVAQPAPIPVSTHSS